MDKTVTQQALEVMGQVAIAPDRPLAALIIQNGEFDGTVNIHHLFVPNLDAESPAHQLMADLIDDMRVLLQRAATVIPRSVQSPVAVVTEPVVVPAPIPTESEGGEHE